jgi:hypothetical protein
MKMIFSPYMILVLLVLLVLSGAVQSIKLDYQQLHQYLRVK